MFLSKSEYIQSINTLLPDNSTQEISPLDLRTSLINLADSVPSFFFGDLTADNFSTPEFRNTRGGVLSMSKLGLAGHSSYDSCAFGYGTLKNNYNGSENTAIGSYALSCNLYGDYNVALGVQSLSGKVKGSGNVGLGSLTLHNNKNGDFNIAIGHGAGYYIGKDDDYKLYIASVPVESNSTCVGDDLVTSGPSPLVYGDLNPNSHRFAIGTNQLHSYGMLQVSGDISPVTTDSFNLGNVNRSWESINQNIYFSGGRVGIGGYPHGPNEGVTDGKMTVFEDLVPNIDKRYALGHPDYQWDGYFNDIQVTGQAIINDLSYNSITSCLYECKVLHLATSGFCDPEDEGFHNDALCGYLNDESLDGAGFIVHSSGTDYQRDYQFLYRFPDSEVTCLEHDDAYSRSRFQSNISLQLVSGVHLQTDRVISNNDRQKLSMVLQSGCMGYFLEAYEVSGQRAIIGQEAHLTGDYPTLVDVNMISRSGTDIGDDGNPEGYDYSVMYGTVDSGVKVVQKFNSRIKSASTAKGFSIVYHDELDK